MTRGRKREPVPTVTGPDHLLTRAQVVALIAARVRNATESEAQARDRVGSQVAYAIEQGAFPAAAARARFRCSDVVNWALGQRKLAAGVAGLPRYAQATGNANASGTASAVGAGIPRTASQKDAEIRALSAEIARLKRAK